MPTASTVRSFFGMGNFPTASDAATSSKRDKTAHRFSASTIIVAPRPTADSKRANGYAQMTNEAIRKRQQIQRNKRVSNADMVKVLRRFQIDIRELTLRD